MKAGVIMKYTRLEIYRGISNSKVKLVIGFFIVIPVIAVISGSIISKVLIPDKQNLNTVQNEDKPLVVINQNITRDYSVYFLQAGAFIGKNNAEKLRNAIKRDDIIPVVVQDEDIYRVIIRISDNRDIILNERDKLQNINYNCLINEFKFAGIENESPEQSEDIIKFTDISIGIIKNLLKLTDGLPEKDSEGLELLKKNCQQLSSIHKEMEEINSTTQVKNFGERFEQYKNEFVNGYEIGNRDECERVTGQMILLLDNCYREILQKYIN